MFIPITKTLSVLRTPYYGLRCLNYLNMRLNNQNGYNM